MVSSTAHASAPGVAHIVHDPASHLEGIIVLHSTNLGPAAGGCRLWDYPTADAMATDAYRLAEGMSYKNAIAGLPFGGGKAVLRRPNRPFDRQRLFEAFGRAVEALAGDYITAEDIGTSVVDMAAAAKSTRYVAGLPAVANRPGGDPSPWTAHGVFLSMAHAVERHLGRPLSDCTVAIQGVGHVGSALAEMLNHAGARLLVADVDGRNVARTVAATGGRAVDHIAILSAKADVFAPCALGAILSDRTIGSLKAKVVCGAANNQLETPEDGARLADRGILYAPDYVVNAGGIINVAAEYLRWSRTEALGRVKTTGERLKAVLDLSDASGRSTNLAADELARDILATSRTSANPHDAIRLPYYRASQTS
jgi:leucine dehydrogenase